MCPCPFCTTVAILLCPLLLFPATRKWLKSKIKKHHCGCDVCQKAEHEQHLQNHTPCHCRVCQEKSSKRRGRPIGSKNKPKRRGRPSKKKAIAVQSKRGRGRPRKIK